MAGKKEPRYTEKQYIAGGEDGGWGETDVMYGGKKIMENAPAEYANELQRELGRAKTMQSVNAQPVEKGPSKQSLQEAEDERIRRLEEKAPTTKTEMGKKKGGVIKSSASRRADGIAQRGKTRGRVV